MDSGEGEKLIQLSFGGGFATGEIQVGFFGRGDHRKHGIHFGDLEQDGDARADAGHGELCGDALRMGPVAQKRAQTRGIHVRDIRQIDDRVRVARFAKSCLQAEQGGESEGSVEAEDVCCAGRATLVRDIHLIHPGNCNTKAEGSDACYGDFTES